MNRDFFKSLSEAYCAISRWFGLVYFLDSLSLDGSRFKLSPKMNVHAIWKADVMHADFTPRSHCAQSS